MDKLQHVLLFPVPEQTRRARRFTQRTQSEKGENSARFLQPLRFSAKTFVLSASKDGRKNLSACYGARPENASTVSRAIFSTLNFSSTDFLPASLNARACSGFKIN